jgi:glucokinase
VSTPKHPDPAALLADIGGTYTRLALLDSSGRLSCSATRCNAEFSELLALLRSYLEELPGLVTPPARAALAVACPVSGDTVKLTNLNWSFSVNALADQLKLHTLKVINDFKAIALSLPHLAAADLVRIGGGTPVPDAALAVIGPGTGLGVSGLIPHDHGWAALEAEGGHVTLAAASQEEDALIDWLRKRYGHASAERVLSGPGLVDLYRYVSSDDEAALAPEEVTELAVERADRHALRAFALFFALLGSVAGNLALTLGARGGVYLAGGILPRVQLLLATSLFRERFLAKGRFRSYLDAIPTYLITDPCPAFKGLAATLTTHA